MALSLDSWFYLIIALLPLMGGLLVSQVNPYKALVIRGILGAIAALVYAVLGAADVALTEALVGTMLAITLYAVAVRSSMVMRLGALESRPDPEAVVRAIRMQLKPYHVRLELVHYSTWQDLHHALTNREIHGLCVQIDDIPPGERFLKTVSSGISTDASSIHVIVRVQRLYEVLVDGLGGGAIATISHADVQPRPEDSAPVLKYSSPNLVEESS